MAPEAGHTFPENRKPSVASLEAGRGPIRESAWPGWWPAAAGGCSRLRRRGNLRCCHERRRRSCRGTTRCCRSCRNPATREINFDAVLIANAVIIKMMFIVSSGE